MNKNTNEFDARDELRAKRKNIKTFEDLTTFLKDVEENYNYDYGVAPRSMAQASVAVAWYLADKFGITGFQAGFVMWDFIRDWIKTSNKCGMKLVDYDDMLYPQYEDKFQKTISSDVWANIQKEAAKRLEDSSNAHPAVIAHWKSIVEGNVPFDYSVKED